MQSIRNSILQRFRVSSPVGIPVFSADGVLRRLSLNMCLSTSAESNMVMDRVVALVKKFDRVDASKVTETADFQKDLSLDSLDRVELVMALEEEFSIEIPEEKADKLSCCADVAKYIAAEQKTGNP